MGDDTLRGVVVDPAGKPIVNALVYLRTKEDQPAVLDSPYTWKARTDPDGRWQIEMAYASRSLLCAWAPGYERAHVLDLDPKQAVRLVLEPSPALTVTVKAPPRKEPLEDARLRVRLPTDGASEFPRPGEDLAAEWDLFVETGKETPLRLPAGAKAFLTADAPGLTSDPAWVELPGVAKSVVLQLVPSATIDLRLIDAATKKPLPLGSGGWGFTSLAHTESGFELDSDWQSDNTIAHGRGIAPGAYVLRLRYRGYVEPSERTIEITKRDQELRLDVVLERDLEHATVHLLLEHAKDSQYAGSRVTSGLTLLRRHEDASPVWKVAPVSMSWMRSDGRLTQTLEDVRPGTYDVLTWGGSRFSPVGHLMGLKVEGGQELRHKVVLREGYGFRPGDVLEGDLGPLRRLRVQSELLGALPWVVPGDETTLFEMDAKGFARVTGEGYVGMFPSKEITLVEILEGGGKRSRKVKASISPPR
ncbi:MAG: carboxypeptidase-like regulatory domain-containing protein [Planctomycetota bacterium]|nr:carboxypeptidase-like regulatory domain-containing protein [Planctomycetota bacterium]